MGEASQTGSHSSALDTMARAVRETAVEGLPPVERWSPPYCGDIGLAIRRDGSWWSQGSRIDREPLVRLFARILRKDDDGRTYLVTPSEKVLVTVEDAPFLAVRAEAVGAPEGPALLMTTNLGETFLLGPKRPLWVRTDAGTGEPRPYARVRGRLDALVTRSTFFELVALAEERQTPEGPTLGVASGGGFFPLGPPGSHRL